MVLDKDDPFLEHNLHRLENRFEKRYLASIMRNNERLAKDKPSHTTTLQSIKDNKRRFMMVRLLEYIMLGSELDFDINGQSL